MRGKKNKALFFMFVCAPLLAYALYTYYHIYQTLPDEPVQQQATSQIAVEGYAWVRQEEYIMGNLTILVQDAQVKNPQSKSIYVFFNGFGLDGFLTPPPPITTSDNIPYARILTITTQAHVYFSMEQKNTIISKILQKKHIEKVSLQGLSMGGIQALEYAATYPEQVDALHLLNPAGFTTTTPTALAWHYVADVFKTSFAMSLGRLAVDSFVEKNLRAASVVFIRNVVTHPIIAIKKITEIAQYNPTTSLQVIARHAIPVHLFLNRGDSVFPVSQVLSHQASFASVNIFTGYHGTLLFTPQSLYSVILHTVR